MRHYHIHEAGHAVAALYVGARLLKVSRRLTLIEADDNLESRFFINIAGPVSEMKFTNKPSDGTAADEALFMQHFIKSKMSHTKFHKWAQKLHSEVNEWVNEPNTWTAIIGIADALDRKRVVSGVEAMRIYQSAKGVV
jgi:DNA phosphorothioation-dependent restriction protein DptG